LLQRHARGWQCVTCRRVSSKWESIAPRRCGGSAAVRWAQRAVDDATRGFVDGGGRRRMLSDDVMWCSRCGAYASSRVVVLAKACRGHPSDAGAAARLDLLRSGRHPVSRAPFMAEVVSEPSSFSCVASVSSQQANACNMNAPSSRFQAVLARVRLREAQGTCA
jgi:hypothetical protein